MTDERWQQLMGNEDLPLTDEEKAAGWHFCPDWDDLLIGPDCSGEMECCGCELNEESQ